MIHEIVDIHKWKTLFPLAAEKSPSGDIVTSPSHIAMIEQIREAELTPSHIAERVPTDVFIFNRGEAPDRAVTKIGGLPYWPAEKAWPHGKTNQPLTFIAQLNFSDSYDIVGDLPGAILLIFGEENEFYHDDDLHCEWMPYQSCDLITQSQLPETEWQIDPCYGSIYRTYDYPVSYKLFDRYGMPYTIPIIEGTKIGGLPRWIQYDVESSGRFLCAFGSIDPSHEIPYPYLNRPEPFRGYENLHNNNLMWGDVGLLNIFLMDQQGHINADTQCY